VYDNGTQRVLGERWNGDESDPHGFPKLFNNPIWHVMPEFVYIAILHALLDELARHPNAVPNPDALQRYRTAILGEIEVRLRE
jgi:hypothetical protein